MAIRSSVASASPDALFALAWAGWPLGMWLASTRAGHLVERFGARKVLVLGAALYWGGFALIGVAPVWMLLFVATFAAGAGNGLFDVAWNRLAPSWAARRQDEEGGSGQFLQLLNSWFSAGSVLAGLLAMVAVAVSLPLAWHLGVVGMAMLAAVVLAARRLPNLKRTDEEDDLEPAVRRGPTPAALRWVGVIGLCAALPVGVGYVWSSIYLARLGATPWLVPAGVIAFTSVETAVRFGVGKLSTRAGRLADPVWLTRAGGFAAVVGIALIVVPATVPATIVGFACLAGGLAPIGGLVQDAAPRWWPEHKGRAAGLVTRYIYTGIVLGPVLVGPLSSGLGSAADADPLRWAIATLAAPIMAVVVLARFMRPIGAGR